MIRKISFIIAVLLVASNSFAATVRTIAAGGGQDHTTIAACVAASVDTDICRITDGATYNERFEPAALDLTLDITGGNTPTVGNISGAGGGRGAFDWAENTAGTATIDGVDGGLTLRMAGGNSIITHTSGTGALTLVVKNLVVQMPGSVGQAGAVLTAANANSDYTFEQVIWAGTTTGGGSVIEFTTASGSFLTVTNNLFHDFPTGIVIAIEVNGSETASTFDIKQNTFVECATGLDTDEKGILQNNIFDTGDDDIVFVSPFVESDGTGNIFTEEPAGSWPASNRFSDTPTYVDSGSNNFRLAAMSDGIDTGIDSGITTDIDGTSRPQGSDHDIGYFEFPTANGLAPGSGSLLGVGLF